MPGSEPRPETLRCVLGQDTLLSQCLSPPRRANEFHVGPLGSYADFTYVDVLKVTSCIYISSNVRALHSTELNISRDNCP